MNNFAEQLARAEKLAKSGSLLIPGVTTDDPPQTLYVPGPTGSPIIPGDGNLWSTGWPDAADDKANAFDFLAGVPLVNEDGFKRATSGFDKASAPDYSAVKCESMPKQPTEELARHWLAAMMAWAPERITDIRITPNGIGWDFTGRLIVDKPKYFGVFKTE